MWKSIHSWKSTYSLLLSLVLISGSFVACVQPGPETKSSPSTTSIPLNPDQGNLAQENLKNSFDDVQKTNNEFQTLLDDFINDVVAARDDSKKRELVNSSQVNQRLVELEEKVNTYKNQILPTINLENLEQNFNDINQNINNIKQITEKLKGGLGKDEIGQVQIYLGIFQSSNDKNYGALSPNTTTEINSSLTTNSEQLKAKIIDLGQVTGLPSSVTPDKDDEKELARKIADLEARNNELATIAKKNEEEIKNLNYEKQENYNQLNQFKNRRRLEIFIVIIVLEITLLLGGLCVYIWQEKRRKKWLLIRSKKAYKNTQKQNNAVNKTGDLDTQTLVYEKLFHEVHDKVEDVEKMYKLWINEAKKLQNQIDNLQQNQQVKTPGNNVDNKKLIVQVVNDKIGEIYRQLQQEIDQRWHLELRKLQNQINQLQQNQQLKTSDNNADNKKLIFEAVKEEIHGQLQQEIRKRLDIELRNLPNQINQPQQNQQLKTPDNIAGGLPNLEFMLIYKEDPRSLSENAIEVSEADRSMVQPRISSTQAVIIQKVRRGNYWILNEADIDYMVPRHNIKINEYNSKTVENLFECQGYQSEYSGFQLIKPAKVSAISKGETWQLVERGILQFD